MKTDTKQAGLPGVQGLRNIVPNCLQALQVSYPTSVRHTRLAGGRGKREEGGELYCGTESFFVGSSTAMMLEGIITNMIAVEGGGEQHCRHQTGKTQSRCLGYLSSCIFRLAKRGASLNVQVDKIPAACNRRKTIVKKVQPPLPLQRKKWTTYV